MKLFLSAFILVIISLSSISSQQYPVYFPIDGNVIGQSKESVLSRYEGTDIQEEVFETEYPGGSIHKFWIGLDTYIYYEFRPFDGDGRLGLYAIQLTTGFSEFPALFGLSLLDPAETILELLGEPSQKIETEMAFGILPEKQAAEIWVYDQFNFSFAVAEGVIHSARIFGLPPMDIQNAQDPLVALAQYGAELNLAERLFYFFPQLIIEKEQVFQNENLFIEAISSEDHPIYQSIFAEDNSLLSPLRNNELANQEWWSDGTQPPVIRSFFNEESVIDYVDIIVLLNRFMVQKIVFK
jgi:hypothetical protein